MEIKSSADFVRMTRAALTGAGFVRHEVDGTVYFQSSFSPRRGEKVPQADEGSIVFVHGANDQAGTWFTVAPTIAQMRRVIIPDLPGHGESAPASGPLPISLIAQRLAAVIDHAAPTQRITLVGNSLGGWMALLYALQYPERVTQLVLESSGGLSRPLSSPLTAQTRGEALQILSAVHGPRYEPQDWVVDALLQRAKGSPMLRLTELLEHDIEPRLGQIKSPATLIWGADDGVVPLSYGEALRDALPNATMCVIEGAAHIAHMQQPRRFLECLTAIS
ncbi:MAG TPA: alpha/beta fold hydrolase [Thermoanaerobaculia bacterium]|nr:alpha/beta fold hydrolase [Thermoanaerobaculia bacterium]